MMASFSVSERSPIETTRSSPVPMVRAAGTMAQSSRVPSASRRSSSPSIRGIENPQMSASSTPTR
jgi:hypothetical protein